MEPILSVGITTRNRRDLVLGAVESVLPQLGMKDELLVVDNGSTDGTREALVEAAERHGSRLRVVVEPVGGVSTARNRALAEARTEIICFLDDDARPCAGWLTAMRAAWAGASPRVAVIGGPIQAVLSRERPEWLADHLLYLVGALDLGEKRRLLDQSPGSGYVWGGNMSLRVAPAVELGGFDIHWGIRPEAPGDTGEEEDLERRLVAAGYEVWYEPSVEVQHLVPAASLTAARLRRNVRDRALGEVQRGARRSAGLPLLLRAAGLFLFAVLGGRPARAVQTSFGVVRGWTLVTAFRDRRPPPRKVQVLGARQEG